MRIAPMVYLSSPSTHVESFTLVPSTVPEALLMRPLLIHVVIVCFELVSYGFNIPSFFALVLLVLVAVVEVVAVELIVVA